MNRCWIQKLQAGSPQSLPHPVPWVTVLCGWVGQDSCGYLGGNICSVIWREVQQPNGNLISVYG